MKRISFFLAALALASCEMEINQLPVEPTDNLVTIKALATKTTLDGNAVVWEANDAINVVFNSSETQYVAEFTTEDAGESAAFTGTLDASVTPETCGETGYAVYPSTIAIESDGKIQFSIPEVQDGKITTGENLSYASVSLANLKANGADEVSFHNALSMLQITVPAGVKSVTIATNKLDFDPNYPAVALAGKAPFFYTEGKLQINDSKWGNSGMEPVPGSEDYETVVYKHKSVVLKNADDSFLAAGVHYVQVFPGTHEGLTITVTGSDFSYTKVIDQSFTFVASKYHPLNVTSIFNLGSTSYAASPFGGTVEIPVITTVDEYEVVLPAEATWLTKTPSSKGAFHKDVVSLTAAANTTGAERTATVKINGVDVVISQKGYVSELLGEYLESYSASGMPQTGTLKIEQTDDASKGVYKLTIAGATVYADYGDSKLTWKEGYTTNTITVSLDFSRYESSYLSVGGNYISDYVAIKALGAPELSAAEEALIGVYNELWTYSGSFDVEEIPEEGMEISASEEAAYGNLKVRLLTYGGYSFNGYANLSDNTLTINVGKQQHGTFNKYMYKDVVLTLTVDSDGTLKFDSWTDAHGNTVTNYVATKVVEQEPEPEPEQPGVLVTPEDLVGIWHEEFVMNGSSISYSEATISLVSGALKVRLFNYVPQWGSPAIIECDAELSVDGSKLTLKTNGITYNYEQFTSDIVLNVSEGGKKLTVSTVSWGYQSISNYTATQL